MSKNKETAKKIRAILNFLKTEKQQIYSKKEKFVSNPFAFNIICYTEKELKGVLEIIK
jgi:hypothetical protein